ncbi:MAG: 30S ribosome-binding factor RbfA [Syntrophorhabdales bacterium]
MRYRRFRLQDQFREEISSIIRQEIKDPGIGFITVLDVRLTEDLKRAKVLYSVYGSQEEKEKTTEALRRAGGYIKHLLGGRVKLRFMPELSFIFDTEQEKRARIDELLEKVKSERVGNVPED